MSNYSVKDGTRIIRVACAVLFVSFTFLYLYDYQDDILAMAQHVLSDGLTHYNRTIGAVLITIVLWLLQIGFYALFRLQGRAHAITFFPSLLTLAIPLPLATFCISAILSITLQIQSCNCS